MNNKLKKYLPLLTGKHLMFLFIFARKIALKKAFILFCRPQKGKVLIGQEEFLEEAEDEIVYIDNLRIQTYRWANMGETVLLVHGWESNTHRWKILIEKLHQKNFNIIAFDAPAHGYSSGKLFNIPLYVECIQKIVELYRPNHIIAHSIGGMTTIFHQFTYPNDEIDKLIILAPPSEMSVIMKGYQKTLNLTDKFMTALNDYFKTKLAFSFKEFSTPAFAKSIKQKGLLIHDIKDNIAPYSGSVEINKNWNNSKLISTENFGHSLFFDEVDDMIIDFLKD